MSTSPTPTPSRRGVRAAIFAALVLAASGFPATPAHAIPALCAPEPTTSSVQWGWPGGADGPAFVGQRFGANLPPELRGPVLEFLDC